MSRTMNLGPAIASAGLNDKVTIFRRKEAVNEYGEENISYEVFPNVAATVYPSGENKLDRRPEAQATERTIGLITKFSLKIAGDNEQADVVRWEGNDYTVVVSNPYSNFGGGFVEAMAVIRTTIGFPAQDRPAEVPA